MKTLFFEIVKAIEKDKKKLTVLASKYTDYCDNSGKGLQVSNISLCFTVC